MQGPNALKKKARQIVLVFALVLTFAVTAEAYTVVMHGGRRVEIPSQFLVTASTLTYEVSPGVQITIAVAAIDISATEKANNELPGSLMRRTRPGSMESQDVVGEDSSRVTSRRTITNRDLEATTRRRHDSEVAYETRRKQLGLPSLEESRKQAAAQADLIRMELAQSRVTKAESEEYWRQRATTLRTEMAALDAELTFVRRQLDEGPPRLGDACFGPLLSNTHSVLPGVPFGNFGNRQVWTVGGGRSAAGVFVAPGVGARISGRAVFGGPPTHGQLQMRAGNHGRSRAARYRFPVFHSGGALISSAPDFDLYERSALITRFNELAAARAGLSARWRALEDEARRAGAPPGWLRP